MIFQFDKIQLARGKTCPFDTRVTWHVIVSSEGVVP